MKKSSLLIRFSLIEALFFAIFSVTSYQTNFLSEVAGLNSAQIGAVSSVGCIVGLIALPLWGVISDKLHSSRLLFTIGITITAVAYMLLPIFSHYVSGVVWPFYIYLSIIFFFRQPQNSLLDGWAVGTLASYGADYSVVRRFGSIGYSIVSVLLGLLIGKCFGLSGAFYSIAIFIFPLAVISLTTKDISVEKADKSNKIHPALLFKNPRFLVYLLYTLGLNIYLSVTLIFLKYILEYAGCSSDVLGLVIGFRALMEILSMSMESRLHKKFSLCTIMILPGILFGLEHLMYRFAFGLPSIFLIMVLSGLAGGIFYSAGPNYVHEIVSPVVQNTAQTMCGMSMAIMGIIGTSIGGIVIERYGIQTLTTGCGILIVLLTLVFILSRRFLTQPTAFTN